MIRSENTAFCQYIQSGIIMPQLKCILLLFQQNLVVHTVPEKEEDSIDYVPPLKE